MKNKGLFVTLEGGEGSGKSTLIQLLKTHLEAQGHRVMVTREPGGVGVAEKIREVILSNEMDSMTEALLFASARREHLVKKVIPALEDGVIVICDRFVHSSLVYQGILGGLGVPTVININQAAIGAYMPDFTLFLDIEPELGLARISANAEREVNRWDKETTAFHHDIRNGYKLLAKKLPEHHIKTIDASGTPDEVLAQSITAFKAFMEPQLVAN